MADKWTEPLRREHQGLAQRLVDLEAALDRLASGPQADVTDNLQSGDDFFQNILKHHAHWEEHHLYPAADEVVREHGTATGPMIAVHRELVKLLDEYQAAVTDLARHPGDARLTDRARVLGYQIIAIVRVHFHEEDVLLDALDEHWPADRRGEVLAHHPH